MTNQYAYYHARRKMQELEAENRRLRAHIKELEDKLSDLSWQINPERMGA